MRVQLPGRVAAILRTTGDSRVFELERGTLTLRRRSLGKVAKFIEGAHGDLTGEVFVLESPRATTAFTNAAGKDTHLKLLLDPEYAPEITDKLGELPGTTLTTSGKFPFKNHAKLFHSGNASVVTSGAFTTETNSRIEAQRTAVPANEQWTRLTDQVAADRQADGQRFTLTPRQQAKLDRLQVTEPG